MVYKLVFISVPRPDENYAASQKSNYINEWSPKLQTLRRDEYASVNGVSSFSDSSKVFLASYEQKQYTQTESMINMIRTTFIVIVLGLASIYFTKDAQELVLEPLERMIEKIEAIAKNPLVAATDSVHEAGALSLAHAKSGKKDNAQYETQTLEKAIIKIGHLLALGFGEAGGNIIGQNMSGNGDLNPMMPGVKTYCIFGFCILSDFNECTEVLQTDIMSYVNIVAEITHSMVDRYGGSANKNIGDAFLMVWKFANPKQIQDMDEKGKFESSKISLQNQVIADMSVFSFLKIIAKLNKYQHVLDYNNNPDMQRKIPGFKVKMGFGLHQGWAIEGAIGSFFKIDASYLSPNVNMAARLEAATKQFETPFLFSGHMFDILSHPVQEICREIDTVTVKGSIKPMRMYTITIDYEHLLPSVDENLEKPIKVKKKDRDAQKVQLFQMLNTGNTTTWEVISSDQDFAELRKFVKPEFETKFKDAYRLYIKGEWGASGDLLEELIKEREHDGPTRNLYKNVVTKANKQCPSDWKGFRALTSK